MHAHESLVGAGDGVGIKGRDVWCASRTLIAENMDGFAKTFNGALDICVVPLSAPIRPPVPFVRTSKVVSEFVNRSDRVSAQAK